MPHDITRRRFVKRLARGTLGAGAAHLAGCSSYGASEPEILYNGIVLPRTWPPIDRPLKSTPITPPYLTSPPQIIPIHVGRQLFVDDFLIHQTTLRRVFFSARYHKRNPVLTPDQWWEREGPYPTSMVYSDGVWYDPQQRLFKMWYMGGYLQSTCYAVSTDGIVWTKPALDVMRGTNVVNWGARDSSSVWRAGDPYLQPQYTMWRSVRIPDGDLWRFVAYRSSDGIHWGEPVGSTGPMQDRSTVFWNPFRLRWIFSLRANAPTFGRVRRYWESTAITGGGQWRTETDPPIWVQADDEDAAWPGSDIRPQLYNLDCVAYESLILGLFTILRGEPHERPKINEVVVGFSRDGFYWDRPSRASFLPVSERSGDWNWGNVQSAGGGCLVVGDELYFYASGRAGRAGTIESGISSTGLATLRRDGFAAMRAETAEGTLTTRPVVFRGGYCFVNVAIRTGALRVEILDFDGRPIQPFTRANCIPIRSNATSQIVAWSRRSDVSSLIGRPVKFRFYLSDGDLFAFWVSRFLDGNSEGPVGAGGPAQSV